MVENGLFGGKIDVAPRALVRFTQVISSESLAGVVRVDCSL